MMTTHVKPESLTDATHQARVDLAAAYRLIHRLGMDDSIYTHISVRLPGTHDRFLINPYGMRFEEVSASNLVTVDIDGKAPVRTLAGSFTTRVWSCIRSSR